MSLETTNHNEQMETGITTRVVLSIESFCSCFDDRKLRQFVNYWLCDGYLKYTILSMQQKCCCFVKLKFKFSRKYYNQFSKTWTNIEMELWFVYFHFGDDNTFIFSRCFFLCRNYLAMMCCRRQYSEDVTQMNEFEIRSYV